MNNVENANTVNMEKLYAEAQLAATKYGTALKTGTLAEQVSAKAVLDKLVDNYNAQIIENAYDEILASDSPVREAIIKKEFDGLIKPSIVRDSQTERVNTVIVKPASSYVQYDLAEVQRLCKKAGKACELQDKWFEMAVSLYSYFNALAGVEIGVNQDAFNKRFGVSADSVITTHDGITVAEQEVDPKTGKVKKADAADPISKRTIQRLLQEAFNRILPGAIKLDRNYNKGEFNPYAHLTHFATVIKRDGNVKTQKPKEFAYEIKNCMHYMLTGNRPEMLGKGTK